MEPIRAEKQQGVDRLGWVDGRMGGRVDGPCGDGVIRQDVTGLNWLW